MSIVLASHLLAEFRGRVDSTNPVELVRAALTGLASYVKMVGDDIASAVPVTEQGRDDVCERLAGISGRACTAADIARLLDDEDESEEEEEDRRRRPTSKPTTLPHHGRALARTSAPHPAKRTRASSSSSSSSSSSPPAKRALSESSSSSAAAIAPPPPFTQSSSSSSTLPAKRASSAAAAIVPFAPPPITWAELGRTLHLSHAVAEALVSVVVKSPELVQRQFYDKLHSRVNAQAGAMLMTACCRVFPRLPDAWILPVLNVVNKIGDETLCTNIVELVARSNFHPDVLEILTAAGNERELRWVAKAAVTCSEADVGKLMVLRREFAEVLEEEEEIGSFHKAVCFDDSSVRLMYMLSRKKEAGGGEQMTMVDEGEEEEEADGGGEVNVNEEQLFDLAKHWGVFDVRGEQGRWRSRIRAGVGYAMVDAVLVKRQGAGKSVAERIQEAVGAPSAPHVKYLLPLGRAAVSSPVLTAVLESDAYIHRPSMFQLNPLLSMARFAAVRSSLEYLWIRCLKVPPKFRQTTAFAIVHAW